MPRGRPKHDHDGDVGTVVEKKTRLQKPALWKVLIHNDDFTTMEFVVKVLEVVFHKGTAEATAIMLQVHQRGVGLAGVYTFEIAETKVATVDRMAQEEGFPLLCTMERE